MDIMQAPQTGAQGPDMAQHLQSMLAQAALVQQLQAHQNAHSQLMQLLQLNQIVQGSTPDASGKLSFLPTRPIPTPSVDPTLTPTSMLLFVLL